MEEPWETDEEHAVRMASARQRADGILALRLRRARFFPANLFADPAYDILLDLFVQERRGRPISITSACLAAGVPPTTALRWIGHLSDLGLVIRTPDPRDKRRVYVALTADSRKRLVTWLSET